MQKTFKAAVYNFKTTGAIYASPPADSFPDAVSVANATSNATRFLRFPQNIVWARKLSDRTTGANRPDCETPQKTLRT